MSDSNTDSITYRPFTHDDIAAAHALTVELKRPHRADDWRFAALLGVGFVAQDASGVIGAALCWNPHVRITPHIASATRPESAVDVVLENLRRHREGQAMLGQIDRAQGY